MDLLATAPEGSDTSLLVSWKAPSESSGVVNRYYVTVTNYSLASVDDLTVPGDTNTTNVSGLGQFYLKVACSALDLYIFSCTPQVPLFLIL